ncbi:serine/threonine protein kinase [Amycolatopsis mediterranei S699]|uniref:non-specific serine/threonine protein kinase n=2 Tax=Amycolatopsis mediterranei TaxID=33910 RepID=A0A0H3D3Q1_AMYMU|nr:serine/threonine protein kinase [Amycolatopsis mediterranei]ADJ44168.1 putative serine/threonine protein kinase [Amycolatopsis mediterranei U32]AEK40903.1 serine/threonine protein kinase [Amycolatopsis mediterranei S699]AFO75880.1 serine/threonine protein kinase [Amycolatopsis mediterranei S699]AGT83009.1 serine/threonine protein kinase [Amycolatopsis mediterranei RB]KDO06915.1 serine/threonine protein kinase [Amycolatopsis mediterranei]
MAREGTLIGDRYRLLGPAGQGAVVWHAQDERLDRIVAVKPLFDEPAPAIPVQRGAICDVVDEDSTTYLVLEYPGARTLTELLDEHGTLAPGLVARFGAQLAAVLAAAHDEGVLHAAVDPDHVVVSAEGHAAIVAGAGGCGARAYLAPEVLDGGFPDFPSEVFSLGATLYAALAGRTHELEQAPHPVTEAVLQLLHPSPTARPTMAVAEELLSAFLPRRPGSRPDGGARRAAAGDYRCV